MLCTLRNSSYVIVTKTLWYRVSFFFLFIVVFYSFIFLFLYLLTWFFGGFLVYATGFTVLHISQMRKPRPREVMRYAQVYLVCKWPDWG